VLPAFLDSCIVQFFSLLWKLVKDWINQAHFKNVENRLLLCSSLAVSVKAQQSIGIAHRFPFVVLSEGKTILSIKSDAALENHEEIFGLFILLVNWVILIKT